MEYSLFILGIVALFSVVQSLFGVGVLVFGTPTLLLLGLPFADVLGWLLPASMTISALQVAANPDFTRRLCVGGRPLLCIVPLVVVLSVLLHFKLHPRVEFFVGAMMLFAAGARLNVALHRRLSQFFRNFEKLSLAAIGTLHGFTNMGGALLSIYAVSVNSTKADIRGTISTYYLLFGLVQLVTVALFSPASLGPHSVVAALVGGTVYGILGRVLFQRASAAFYDRAITGLILTYGIALFVRGAL